MESIPHSEKLDNGSSGLHSSQSEHHALSRRGISPTTAAHFQITADLHGWRYPVDPQHGPVRFKAFDSSAPRKYAWLPSKPTDARFYDPAGELAEAVARAGGLLILATGEPDVWAAYEGGLEHVTCTLAGEGSIPAWFVDELRALGVRQVIYFPDLDEAGRAGAYKVRDALADAGIALELRQLPAELGQAGDLNRLLLHVGPDRFALALMACDRLALPDRVPSAPVVAATPTDTPMPGDGSELAEVEARTRAETGRVLVKRGTKPGVFACPLDHGHAGKDFLFNVEPGTPIGGCMGKHRGQLTRWRDLADQLGIDVAQIARDVAAERRQSRAAVTRPNAGLQKQSANELGNATPEAQATRFPYGMPYTISHRLRNAHFKSDVVSQHPADLVWHVWQELADELPTGAPSVGEFQAATQHTGRNLSRDTVKTGLEMLAAWGVGEFCDDCDLPTKNDQVVRLQKCQNSKRGRKARRFRFFPIDQQIANFERHYTYLLRERAYVGVPSDVQPDYGDLDADDVARLDAISAPVYEQYAAQREAALHRLDQGTGPLARAMHNIRAGRYRVSQLPPGELRNAPAYRRALHLAGVPEDGAPNEEAYKRQYEIGVSRATLARVRAANGVITVPREKVIPLDQVNDYQRDHGLVLAEHSNGTATVRAASAEKRADLADDHERAAYEALRRRQQAIRGRAGDHSPAQRETPLTIPATYSEAHLLEQFEFRPGADQIPRFDPDTGEVYSPAELWRALAATVAGEHDKGVNLAAGAHDARPRGQVAAQEYEPQIARVVFPAASRRPGRPQQPGDGFWAWIGNVAAELEAAGR